MKIQFCWGWCRRIEAALLYFGDIRGGSKCEIDGKILLSFEIGFVSVDAVGEIWKFWNLKILYLENLISNF